MPPRAAAGMMAEAGPVADMPNAAILTKSLLVLGGARSGKSR
jgi:hypothetical protein